MELRRLEPDDPRPAFTCGDDDLDEYFHLDSIQGSKELLSVTYAFLDEDSGEALAFFSVSNDSVKKEDCGRSAFDRIRDIFPRSKRYKSMPAVKIGRLGICGDRQRDGVGTKVIDFLKAWFTQGNKTGCRFIIVDAYNKENVTAFYQKNGFEFMTLNDDGEAARIMYFDLKQFRP